MSTLTINFTDPSVESITVANCGAEFVGEDNDSFELPSDADHHAIVAAIMKAEGEHLHSQFQDHLDAFVFFDTRTEEFHDWRGDGDNKFRGYFLNTTELLPGIQSIDVTPSEGDD